MSSDERPRRTNAGEAGGFLAATDSVEVMPEPGVTQQEPGNEDDAQEEEDRVRQGTETAVPQTLEFGRDRAGRSRRSWS